MKLFTELINNLVVNNAGLPLGQEKSGWVLKNDKNQEKMGGFEKKSGFFFKVEKHQN